MRIALGVLALLVVGLAWWLWTPDRSRADLEKTYLRGPQDYVTVAGVRLHVRDDGPRDAPVLLLIHGYAASLHTWEAWAADLAKDHRVVRFDLPGHGLSDPDPKDDYSATRSVEVALALMDRLGIASATVVGNSLGGELAWRLALAVPERVEKLVLIAPAGFLSPGQTYGEAPEIPAWSRIVAVALPRLIVRKSLEGIYGEPARLTAATVDRYWAMLRAPGIRRALLERMGQFIVDPPEPLLTKVRQKTLLLWGERDIGIPIDNAKDFLALLPDARLMRYPDAGHVPMEEIPDRTLADLRAFLAER